MASQVLPCESGKFKSSMNLTTIGLPEGLIDLVATQSVISADATTSLMVDTVVPLAPVIISPSAGSILGSTLQVIDGTCEDGARINFYGNIVANNLITLDSTPPNAPTISSPANGLLTNQVSQTIVGTCETGATVIITSADIVGSPITGLCSASNYSMAVTLTSNNSTKTYSVSQQDLAGNTSGARTRNIVIDKLAPAAPTVTSHAQGEYINAASITISGDCENNATVLITGDIVGTPSSVCVSSFYSIAVTLTAGEGTNSLSVNQTDIAGNTSLATARNLILDTIAPSVVVSSAVSSPTPTSPIDYTITFSEDVQIFDNTVVTVTNGSMSNNTGGPDIYNIEITPTGVGNVSVQVLASKTIDLAGNADTASNTMTINYQTSTLAILSPVDGAALDPSAVLTVSGTCVVGAGSVVITGTAKVVVSSSTSCAPSGTFTINITTVASGGPYTLIATQAALNDTVSNLWIHCAGLAMRSCALAGSGNPSDPYMVGDISCLQEMRVGLTCSYALNNDIDASATATWNDDGLNFRGWGPIPNTAIATTRFTGKLDGRNKIISNLFITPRFPNGTGMFSRIYDEGNSVVDEQVFDLTLANPSMSLFTEETFGFLAGTIELAGIRNINIATANGDLSVASSRYNIGLLAGIVSSSDISDSSTSGSFYLDGSYDEANTKYENIGGFVGQINDSTANNNLSDFTITSSATNLIYMFNIGGGFGDINASTISGFKTNFDIDVIYVGVNGFDKGIGNVAGFAGVSRTGSSISDICVNHNMILKTTNKPMSNLAGFVGSVSMGGSDPHTNNRISVEGSLTIDANGLGVTASSPYVGGDLGPSSHTDIVVKSDVVITNAVSPNPWDSYGGIMDQARSNISITNALSLSNHSIAPGINYQSGFVALIDGAVNSGYYANDGFLGGLPYGYGGSGVIDITTTNLSTLGGYLDASYVGFNFTTIWERDPTSYYGVTNLPKLQYCP